MAKKGDRQVITLACPTCKSRNYSTFKNKRNDTERMELNKYCPRCRSYQAHRETR